jgi:hypothetical protein
MSTRTIAAGVIAVAITLSGATAVHAQPRPEPAETAATSGQARTRLVAEERHSTSTQERRLIHHELIQVLVDGQ